MQLRLRNPAARKRTPLYVEAVAGSSSACKIRRMSRWWCGDVGLGAAANRDGRHPGGRIFEFRIRQFRRLVLVSLRERPGFAQSLALLRHPRWFKHLRHDAAPRALLSENRWINTAPANRLAPLAGATFAVRKYSMRHPPEYHLHLLFDPFLLQEPTAHSGTLPAVFRGAFAQACLQKKPAGALYPYTLHLLHECQSRHAGRRLFFFVRQGPRHRFPKAETTIALSAASPRAACA